MAERTLTAMYDDRSAAEAARDQLVRLGVPSGDVTIRGTDAGTTATANPPEGESKGFLDSLADLFAPEEDRHAYAEGLRRGGHLLSARVPDGLEDRAIDLLEGSGAVDVDERAEGWRQGGWAGHQAGASGPAGVTSTARAGGAADTAGYASAAGTTGHTTATAGATGLGAAGTSTTRDVGEGGVVERAEERLRVGKREVGRGTVRVRSYVVERPVEEQVNLRQERVEVERRPVDRPVEPGDPVFEEKVIEASERGEEAVVSKQARVVEEVGIRKEAETRTETVRDTVREQKVDIEDERAGRDVTGTERVTTERDRTGR